MHLRKIIFVLGLGITTLTFAAGELDKVTKEGQRRTEEGKVAQAKVNKLSDSAADIVSKFKTVSKTVDGLKVYNDLLQIQVGNQRKEINSTQESIANVGSIERHVVPLMVRMIDSLEQFITGRAVLTG
jgi:galactitol-specific phosphotransferase system IIB component